MDLQRVLKGMHEWLYVIVVTALALYLVLGLVVWAFMMLSGIPAPESFTTIIATVAGGLVGIVAPASAQATERAGKDTDSG